MTWRFFCGMAWAARCGGSAHSGFWFRIYGYGLHVCTRPRERALFSERYGYAKALYAFGLRLEWLVP